MKLKTQNIIIAAGGIVGCVALAAFYATAYPGHILWQEQNQIFLNEQHWLASYFDKPAWLGCMAGEWLTQFFYDPWIGAFIMTIIIAICTAAFAAVALRICKTTNTMQLSHGIAWTLTLLFAALMVACSLSASSQLSFFICVAGGIGLGLTDASISINNRHRYDISPVLVPLSYWAFGFGSMITAIVIILLSVKRGLMKSKIKSFLILAGLAVILALGFPALLCKTYSLPYTKALLYPGLAKPSLPQTHFEQQLSIADAFYKRDCNKAKLLALTADSPDDVTSFYYYLASAVKDSLPDNLLKYPIKNLGTLTTIGENTPLPVINMMNDLYFELGDMTYAERAAMMRNVFSPRNRNVRMMRRLAEINLVSGDTLAALKYLRILDCTSLYSDWSKAHTPGQTSPEVETEILRRRALSNSKDNIRLGDNCRNIILELLESNPGNTVALDYLLCTDLLLKDMDTFKMDYDTYCIGKGQPRHKDLYQQALMIYLAGTDAPEEEWERYIVPGSLLQRFNAYSNRRGDPSFRGTYWYYFDKQ